MWKKIEYYKEVKNIPVGCKIRIDGQETVLTSHYEDDDYGFDTRDRIFKGYDTIPNSLVRSGLVKIEYWEEEKMYKIEQRKINWVKKFPKMDINPSVKYIIPISCVKQAELVNDACKLLFNDCISPEDSVGNGIGFKSGLVFFNPVNKESAIFIDPDVFIIQFHPDYQDREVIEVMGKKYYKDDLEKLLKELKAVD